MGSAQSAKRKGLFSSLAFSTRYHRLPDSSDLLSQQPLLLDQNRITEIEHEAQAYWEKYAALEKEISGLKSNFSRLETMVQDSSTKRQVRVTLEAAKAIEGGTQKAITGLKEKVDGLKKSLDGEIKGREADKRVYSSKFLNQGMAIKSLEGKNIKAGKEIAELKSRVDEMTPTLVELAAVIAELKHESHQTKEALESAEFRITDMEVVKISKEELYYILIFLIGVLIGLNF